VPPSFPSPEGIRDLLSLNDCSCQNAACSMKRRSFL
jgi:hypothetical protein